MLDVKNKKHECYSLCTIAVVKRKNILDSVLNQGKRLDTGVETMLVHLDGVNTTECEISITRRIRQG